ncbi:hypothetical protein [Streptomyces sp. NPDC088350]|uniref:hypothetical protein n=1 Tax=Streptomyces sp. NPDC088350 TaxID=3365854 RepID=UPI003819AD2D
MSHQTARPTPEPLAFMDESESDRKADPDTYLLAVTLVQPQTLDPTRATMLSLRAPGQRKLHWHSESSRRRAFVIERIAALDAQHLIVVRDGRPGEASERRRRKCLARTAWELDLRGVTRLIAESREARQNGRDMKTIAYLRSNGTIGSALRLFHEPGPREPLLWAADSVAGAYVAARTGTPGYFDTVRHAVEVIRFTADDG